MLTYAAFWVDILHHDLMAFFSHCYGSKIKIKKKDQLALVTVFYSNGNIYNRGVAKRHYLLFGSGLLIL